MKCKDCGVETTGCTGRCRTCKFARRATLRKLRVAREKREARERASVYRRSIGSDTTTGAAERWL